MPQTQTNVTGAYLKDLERTYRPVYATRSPFVVPDLTLKALARDLVRPLRSLYPGVFLENKSQPLFDYYVFQKR
ncbi:hypothetical protein D3C87_1909750 [compost metagenome]